MSYSSLVAARDVISRFAERLYRKRRVSYESGEIDVEYFEERAGELLSSEKELFSEWDEFDVVGVGGARIIVSVENEDGVFKLPRWAPDEYVMYDGLEQNEYEVLMWESVVEEFSEGERPKLLPVLDYGCVDGDYVWVNVPEADTSREALDKFESPVESVVASLSPIRKYVHLGDVRSGNLGVYDGEVVLIDYGSDPENVPGV